jgi:hypothetical protein
MVPARANGSICTLHIVAQSYLLFATTSKESGKAALARTGLGPQGEGAMGMCPHHFPITDTSVVGTPEL